MHLIRSIGIMVGAILIAACSNLKELQQSVVELQQLQASLTERFGGPGIVVNETSTTLIVTFVNSDLAKLPSDQRTAKAREVAEFVREHFPGYARLTSISIALQTRSSLGVASFSRTQTPYTYRTAELGPSALPPVHSDTVSPQGQRPR
ncbi:MAG TPA: hypothetical protein VMG41_06305 [Gemmatimonadales bacterium]|nr:hypothetical protein [Gemmatimonadales bacterium]